MPSLPDHLICVNGCYRFRMRVPEKLRPHIGKREFRKSFGRVSLAEAKQLLFVEHGKALAAIGIAQRELSPKLDTGIVAALAKPSDAELWSYVAAWFVKKRSDDERSNVNDERVQGLIEDIGYSLNPDDPANFMFGFRKDASKILGEHSVSLDENSPEFWKMARLVRDATVERNKRLVRDGTGDLTIILDERFAGLDETTLPKRQVGLTLAQLAARYHSDAAKAKVLPRTKIKQKITIDLCLDILGHDAPVKSIGREKARYLFDSISRLPANLRKRFKGKSVSEVLDMSPTVVGKPMKPVTANDYLSSFRSLMQFGVNEHLINRNPADGLRVCLRLSQWTMRRHSKLPMATWIMALETSSRLS